MTGSAIPSQLQSKLAELHQNAKSATLFIETGEACLDMAIERAQSIAQHLKPSNHRSEQVANRPTVLLLLSQEHLAKALALQNNLPCKSFTCLSEEQSPKQDMTSLSGPSQVLATTPQRVIDHVRRDNILLKGTSQVVVAYGFEAGPGETPDQLMFRGKAFLDDIRFVFTKLADDARVEIYVDSLSSLSRQPAELVEFPVVVPRSSWEKPVHTVQFRVAASNTPSTIAGVMHAAAQPSWILVHHNPITAAHLSALLCKDTPRLCVADIRFEHLATLEWSNTPPSGTVLAFGLTTEEILSLIRRLQTWTGTVTGIVCIISPEQESDILKTKETLLMNNETKAAPDAAEILAGKIQSVAANIRKDANPEELEQLKKLYRKYVSFLDRGNFTAFLLREYLNGPRTSSRNRPERKEAPAVKTRKETTPEEIRAATPKIPSEKPVQAATENEVQDKPVSRPIPEGAKTVYLNVGKMKRLFTRELSQLVQDQLGITRDDIYSIRIHDKYSFITLSAEHAEQAIAKLDGMEIKGRVASASYSNKD